MKKLVAFTCSLALLCASVPVLPVKETAVITANAYEEGTYENLKYYKYTDHISIFGITVERDAITEVNIPSEIDGLPVTQVSGLSSCTNLTSVTLPETLTTLGSYAFYYCTALTSITLPESLTTIGDEAFDYCTGLTSITFPENLASIGSEAFYYCTNLTSVTIPENVTAIGHSAFGNCSNLTSIEISENNPAYTTENNTIFNKEKTALLQYYPSNAETEYTVPDTVTNIGTYAFYRCSTLNSVILPENVATIEYSAFSNCSLTMTIKNPDCEIYDSEYTISKNCLIYGYQNSTAQAYAEKYQRGRAFAVIGAEETAPPEPASPVSLTAEKHSVIVDTISRNTGSSSGWFSTSDYNNGFTTTDTVQELQDASGNIYALCGGGEKVTLVSESNPENTVLLQKEGFQCGGAAIDENNHLFILWGHTLSTSEAEADPENINLIVIKYDLQGNTLGECGIPLSTSRAQYPFSSGNANLLVKDNVLGCLFNTQWTSGHQGAEFAAINAETMELIEFSTWQGSHSFGVSMIPTEYGFAAIQMGDAPHARGINFNSYYVSGEEFKDDYLSSNGYTVLYHSSGDYGTNENQLDGNRTYTHMGGLAKAKTTYAIAGKSERVYTSDVYRTSGLQTGVYDVFVKIVDESLASNVVGLAGEDRINQATGKVTDRNVIWLTQCNETEKAGQVKVVTLENNTYCVLWDKYVNNAFDSVHYVILDECGNLLQQESEIKNAKLSATSIQPIVQGTTLTWAVAEIKWNYSDDGESEKTLTFYQADLSNTSEPPEEDSDMIWKGIDPDINEDSQINAKDASIILVHAAETGAGTALTYTGTLPDMNRDGIVNSKDAAMVLVYSAEYGAGNVKNFKEFMDKQYPEG